MEAPPEALPLPPAAYGRPEGTDLPTRAPEGHGDQPVNAPPLLCGEWQPSGNAPRRRVCGQHVARWPGDWSPLQRCLEHLGEPVRARLLAERARPVRDRRPLPPDLRPLALALGPVACHCGQRGHGRQFRTDPPPVVPVPQNPIYGPNPTEKPKPKPKRLRTWNSIK